MGYFAQQVHWLDCVLGEKKAVLLQGQVSGQRASWRKERVLQACWQNHRA